MNDHFWALSSDKERWKRIVAAAKRPEGARMIPVDEVIEMLVLVVDELIDRSKPSP